MIYFWLWYYLWQAQSILISGIVTVGGVIDKLQWACLWIVAIVFMLGLTSIRACTIGEGVD